jgi:hypothetical protein
MNICKSISLILLVSIGFNGYSQEDDLLSLLGEEETVNYTTASFKSTRVINLHSTENMAAGELDIRISHRFGYISGGLYELYGLDESTIRLGADYGITDRLMIGAGRSSYEKTYDGFFKYKILRQSTGARNTPLTMAFMSSMAIKTLKPSDPTRENYFSNNLYYTFQLVLGRKFSDNFSLEIVPSLVHRNLVATVEEENDVFAIGAGGRIKLSKRVSLNAEYIYVLPNQLAPQYYNSLSIGFDIETGGHVFQLHFSNSTSMIERGFIAETLGHWGKGKDPEGEPFTIHFGFNLSRVFNVK